MRRRLAWILAGPAAALLAWACDERFPAQLLPPSPPALLDAGGDAADATAIVPKGTRTLGVEVEIDSLAFPDQVRKLVDAGAQTTNATFAWTQIEGPFDAGPDADTDAEAGTLIFNAGFHIIGLVLGGSNVRASLAVAALDGTGPRMPADLAGRALDDPEVAARYDLVTDYVFSQVSDLEIDAYLVATDVEATLGADAAKWAAFATFVDRAAKHARTKRANLAVGFVVSGDALVEKRELVAAALAASDVVVVSQPSSFDAIVDAAPAAKPMLVHRIGLDAGDAFGQWDRHAARIPIVTFPAVSADLVREARARGF